MKVSRRRGRSSRKRKEREEKGVSVKREEVE